MILTGKLSAEQGLTGKLSVGTGTVSPETLTVEEVDEIFDDAEVIINE